MHTSPSHAEVGQQRINLICIRLERNGGMEVQQEHLQVLENLSTSLFCSSDGRFMLTFANTAYINAKKYLKHAHLAEEKFKK